MQLQRTSTKGKVVFFIGISLLLIGIIIIALNRHQLGKLTGSDNHKQLKNIIDSLEHEPPKFEIGYIILDINRLKQQDGRHDKGSLSFLLLKNEILERIKLDSPLLIPDYSNVVVTDDAYDFATNYKKKLVFLESTDVGCLIIKQIGGGDAKEITLSIKNLDIPEVINFYDGTDLSYLLSEDSSIDKDQFMEYKISNMGTGSSVLLPLFVWNVFNRTEKNEVVGVWNLITHRVIIPMTMSYHFNGKNEQMPLREVLSRPIVMN